MRPHRHFLRPARQRESAMTLVEMMFAMLVMTVIVAGLMSINFLGLRTARLMEAKAGASETARRSVNQLIYDIRSAKGYEIGTVTGTNFTAITNGAQQAAGLRLWTVTVSSNQVVDPNRFTLYYFDNSEAATQNGKLWRRTSNNTNPAVVVVSNLINTLQFTSEDYWGRTQTIRTYKGVIRATFQFSQFQYPLTPVGTNGLFDYYRIELRATPHVPNGS